MRYIDKLLNNVTMYKVILYSLRLLVAISLVLSVLGLIDFNPLQLLATLGILIVVGEAVNFTAAKLLNVPRNIESMPITALILYFILLPAQGWTDAGFIALAAAVAMLSKYVFVIRDRHVFNPAAVGAFVVGLLGAGSVGWWVGSAALLVPVIVLGLLVVRKVRRFQMVGLFVLVTLVVTVAAAAIGGKAMDEALTATVVSGPLIFFATFMLTEPLTMPPVHRARLWYAGIIGVLFALPFSVGPLYNGPEFALLVGNAVAFAVHPARQLRLKLKHKHQLVPGVFELAFVPNRQFNFEPGQYMEWTLWHDKPDIRGIRRYFTIASSPTEKYVRLAVHTADRPSSFKKALLELPEGGEIRAGQVAGDFTLPNDSTAKVVFIAGGIGVTPFRSMVQYLIDSGERRDAVLLYTAVAADGFAYRELLDAAQEKVGLQTHYVVTNPERAPEGWDGETGYITANMLQELVPDYRERVFYLSGPGAMVDSYSKLLQDQNVPGSHIKTDYFPGL